MTPRRALLEVGAIVAFNLAASYAWLTDAGRQAAHDYLGDNPTLVINLISGAMFLALAVWLARRDASRRETFGLVAVPVLRALAWAAITALACKVISIPAVVAWRALGNHDRSMIAAIERVAKEPLAGVLAMALWAGIWEELVFRGFILSRARVAFRGWLSTPARADAAAVLFQALMFGLVHVWQNGEGQVNAALMGVVLGYVAIRCRSIIPGMIGHAAIDLTALLIARAGLLHR